MFAKKILKHIHSVILKQLQRLRNDDAKCKGAQVMTKRQMQKLNVQAMGRGHNADGENCRPKVCLSMARP